MVGVGPLLGLLGMVAELLRSLGRWWLSVMGSHGPGTRKTGWMGSRNC